MENEFDYLVIGFYPDYEEPYTEVVKSVSATSAIEATRIAVQRADYGMVPIAVIRIPSHEDTDTDITKYLVADFNDIGHIRKSAYDD